MTTSGRIIAWLSAGITYWLSVSLVAGVTEPWDADGFWHLWYPLALILCAAAGYALRRRGWLGGMLIVLAQLPYLGRDCVSGGTRDDMWVAGLVMLGLLALPAVAVSAFAGGIASRSARGA